MTYFEKLCKKRQAKLQASLMNCSSLSGALPCPSVHLWEQEGGMDGRGSVTYRLVCGGRSGQLRGLPSSHGVLEAVVVSYGSIKRFLEENHSQVQV